MEDKEWLGVKDAAKVLGVSVQTLQRWDRLGLLVAHRSLSNRRMYIKSEVLAASPTVWKESDGDPRVPPFVGGVE